MNDPLDNDETIAETAASNPPNIRWKSLIYIVIMVLASLLYSIVVTPVSLTPVLLLYKSIVLLCSFIVLGAIIVLVRLLIQKIKPAQAASAPKTPIWFRILRTGFWGLLTCVLLILFDKLLL